MIGFCEFHEAVVDWGVVKFVVKDRCVEEDNALKFAHGIETGASAKAFLGIFAVGEKLKLVCNAARNDEIIAKETGFGDFDEARIHQR